MKVFVGTEAVRGSTREDASDAQEHVKHRRTRQPVHGRQEPPQYWGAAWVARKTVRNQPRPSGPQPPEEGASIKSEDMDDITILPCERTRHLS